MEWIPQIAIMLFGLPSCYLGTSPQFNVRRWAYVLAICAQPFWFWTTIGHSQWGMVVLCCIYAMLHFRGFYLHWIRPHALLEKA